jgi:signal transduction histidine kinase
MNHLDRFSRHLGWMIFFSVFLPGAISLGLYILLHDILNISIIWSLLAVGPLYLLLTVWASFSAHTMSLTPVQKLWQAIWHISPNANMPAPDIETIKLGRELISSLVLQVYELASHGSNIQQASGNPGIIPSLDPSSLLEHVPIPLIILDKERVVTGINNNACNYLMVPREEALNHHINDILNLSFSSDDTFENWLNNVSTHLATASKNWEHARLQLNDGATIKQFDFAAAYSKDNSAGYETVLALFDKTETYKKQDEAISYVALAVHELRTPVTVLRGYIEVFDDELGSQLTPELREFMRKMSAAAQSLTAFVSNILNVARVDENQLVLSLHEASWNEVLPEIIKDLELRASVRGKTIELDIDENLPTVAIDKISIYEVISNLVDNAIKYSGTSPKIIIHSRLNSDNFIETTVQDFGLGIPESAIGGLFTKFYRSHRSMNAVSGSGLGLYLVKAIVVAHGGNVWVNSKEGEGSSFSFSLQTYASVAAESDIKIKDGIERQASGWIKNHSLYRR